MSSDDETTTAMVATEEKYNDPADIIDYEALTAEEQSEWNCGFCKEVCRNPASIPCCLSLICVTCLETHLKQPTNGLGTRCMFCRGSLHEVRQVQRSAILRARLVKLRVNCENAERGCTESYIFGHTGGKQHTAVCKYRPVLMDECCGKTIAYKDVQAHISANAWKCPECVPCPNACDSYSHFGRHIMPLLPAAVEHHVRSHCRAALVECPLCEKQMKREMLDHHRYMDCPNVLESCRGCCVRLKRCEMKIHKDCVSHCANSKRCPNNCEVSDYPADDALRKEKGRKPTHWFYTYPDKYSRFIMANQMEKHLKDVCAKRKKIKRKHEERNKSKTKKNKHSTSSSKKVKRGVVEEMEEDEQSEPEEDEQTEEQLQQSESENESITA